MATTVRLKINQPKAVEAMQRLGRAAVKRAADRTADRARQNLMMENRINTGALLDSIRVEKSSGPMGYEVSAGKGLPDKRAIYQEKGTRAHGPVTAKVLRFKPKGSSTFVFAQRVRGVTAANYMLRAKRALSVRDFAE